MSMAPNDGCYIRAYQYKSKEGYSSVCDNPQGCSVSFSALTGPLSENQATSVYCYCNQPTPKRCGTIYENDATDAEVREVMAGGHNYITEAPGTILWEGAILGNNYD